MDYSSDSISSPPLTVGDRVWTEEGYSDHGPMSERYSKGLFCIDRFRTRTESESAICFEGEILLTLGSYGGFRGAEMNMQYDSKSMKGQLDQEDRSKWINFFAPLATLQKIPSRITTLPSTRLPDSLTGSGAVEGGQVSGLLVSLLDTFLWMVPLGDRGGDGSRRDAVRLPSHPQKKTLYLNKLLIKRQCIIPPTESEEAVLPMRHRPRRRHHHRRYRPQLIRGNRSGHL